MMRSTIAQPVHAEGPPRTAAQEKQPDFGRLEAAPLLVRSRFASPRDACRPLRAGSAKTGLHGPPRGFTVPGVARAKTTTGGYISYFLLMIEILNATAADPAQNRPLVKTYAFLLLCPFDEWCRVFSPTTAISRRSSARSTSRTRSRCV